MGITNSNKEIDVSRIDCDGTVKVTLGLSAAPDISSNPTDIVLVLGPFREYGWKSSCQYESRSKDFYRHY